MDKDYWRLKKREQRAKKKTEKPSVTLPEAPRIHAVDMLKCPEGVDAREWKYALERAGRAKKYAAMFPEHVRKSEERFQDPVWQWENEVRGRFGGVVGGNLKQ
jgi:hypothetical protein